MQPDSVVTANGRLIVFLPDWANQAIRSHACHNTWRDLSRVEKLEVLQLFYLSNLVEDGQDGTDFDGDVTDAIRALQTKYRGDG
jgi:hypothetical protein